MVSKKLKGFTLIELLVVVGIMAVLTALLVPVIIRARRVAADNAAVTALTRACEGFGNDTATGLKAYTSAAEYYADLSKAEWNYLSLIAPAATSSGFVTKTQLRNPTNVGAGTIASGEGVKCQVDRAGVVNYSSAAVVP